MLIWEKLLQPKRLRENLTVEKSESDNRSPFKKDFDTVCNSTVLRRLQDKAQVFPLEKEDYARTRLTHSIEVMSIAESLSFSAISTIKMNQPKYISSAKVKNKKEAALALIDEIPYILKTTALLHDMGNPPFGHLGEEIIGEWFKNNLGNLSFNTDRKLVFGTGKESKETLEFMFKGKRAEDLKHFEGNAQLFRLVTKLCWNVDEYGMNLSYPVLASFIKYPISSTQIDPSKGLFYKKAGYYTSEESLFKKISSELHLGNNRHPLAFLLEASDDIAYLTADIEDAHRKGLISARTIRDYLQNNTSDPIISRLLQAMDDYTTLADEMKYEDQECYVVHRLRVLMKGLMINAVNEAFSDKYVDIMEGKLKNELLEVSSACNLVKCLKRIEKERIYYCPQIVKSKTKAIAVLTKLLEVYVPAIVNWDESERQSDSTNNLLYLSLSKNYRHVCELENRKVMNGSSSIEEKLEICTYNKILLVADQISGMTDSHALSVYRTITAT